jgi:hypothetical protein
MRLVKCFRASEMPVELRPNFPQDGVWTYRVGQSRSLYAKEKQLDNFFTLRGAAHGELVLIEND